MTLIKGADVDYHSLMIFFKVQRTLTHPHEYCLAQTLFALIVVAMHGIRTQLSIVSVLKVRNRDGIRDCNQSTGEGTLAQLWVALALLEGFGFGVRHWKEAISLLLPKERNEKERWLNLGVDIKDWVRALLEAATQIKCQWCTC